MKKIVFLVIFSFTSAFAEFIGASSSAPTSSTTSTTGTVTAEQLGGMSFFSPEQIRQDFINQDTKKYESDNFKIVDKNKLLEQGILKSGFTGIVTGTMDVDCNSFVSENYTATIYDIDVLSGTVSCMFANKGRLYEPIDLFSVKFTEIQKQHAEDTALAKQQNASIIAQKDAIYQSLKSEKNQIATMSSVNPNYLNLTQLLTAGVLTDENIIDIEGTRNTGSLMLVGEYTSIFYNQNGQEIEDNGKYIKADIVSLYATYASISNIVLESLLALTFILAIFTAGQFAFKFVDKLGDDDANEKKQNKISFILSLAIGIIIFFPQNTIKTDKEEYKQVQSNFQTLSKGGFYWFSDLADKFTKAMLDNELDSIILKSGIGSSSELVFNASKMAQYKKVSDTYEKLANEARNSYTDIILYSTASNQFPISEKWAYAISFAKPLAGLSFYNTYPNGNVLSNAYTSSASDTEKNYPKYAFSFGYRINQKKAKSDANYNAYKTAYQSLVKTAANQDEKIEIIKTLISSQYELFRDYGYLAILNLPVMSLQTGSNQKLYKSEDLTAEIDKKINKDDGVIGGDSSKKFLGDFFTSIPFMFVPGAGTVFSATQSTFRDISQGAGDTLAGWIGSKFGSNVALAVASNSAAYSIAQLFISLFLEILPIVAIIGIGLVRFLAIILKILSFHFGTLLMFPLVFTQKGSFYMKKFSVNVMLLMLEQPLFVLAVWLAFVAYGILHNFGDIFAKRMIAGMMLNNSAQNAFSWSIEGLLNFLPNLGNIIKIYIINGALLIGISLFSLAVIYKLLVTYHSTLFEALELYGSKTLDDAIGSVSNEIQMKGKI